MRVALTASLVAPIREAEANGPHAVIVDLARGLEARGHSVAIYAAAGSRVRGIRVVEVPVDPMAAEAAVKADKTPSAAALDALDRGFERLFATLGERGADVISQHAFDAAPFRLARGMRVVHTLHLPPVDQAVVDAARNGSAALVTVSRAAARAWRDAGVSNVDVIRNGVPDLGAGTRDEPPFALIAGRVSPEKGTHIAIRAAREAGLPFRVVGDIYDRDYFARDVAPLLPGTATVRPVTRAKLSELMARAAVTLMPIRWEETFGLVAAEAHMCGCPVVAFRRGAMSEVVKNGVTGFLIEPDDESAFAAAIAPGTRLDRATIRATAQSTLGLDRMIDDYERLLMSVAAGEAPVG
jgi:glycosyltransferase involved in cell wall biosynthesis